MSKFKNLLCGARSFVLIAGMTGQVFAQAVPPYVDALGNRVNGIPVVCQNIVTGQAESCAGSGGGGGGGTASSVTLLAGTAGIGSINNSAFGISGLLPAFATVPTFNIGTFTGMATEAKQDTGNASLAAIAGNTAQGSNATGQSPLPGGTGTFGWLSSQYKLLSDIKSSIDATATPTGPAGTPNPLVLSTQGANENLSLGTYTSLTTAGTVLTTSSTGFVGTQFTFTNGSPYQEVSIEVTAMSSGDSLTLQTGSSNETVQLSRVSSPDLSSSTGSGTLGTFYAKIPSGGFQIYKNGTAGAATFKVFLSKIVTPIKIRAVSFIGGSTLTTTTVPVTTTATAILAADTGKVVRVITNLGSSTVFIGVAGVSTSTGYPLLAGQSWEFSRFSGALFGVVASGTNNVSVIQY